MLGFFFLVDKILAILRQVIIARQFGLSSDLDVFNVANNLPDLLFALISGGAIAIAFIPVLSEVLSKEGKNESWKLFSRVANLAFLITGILSLVIALLADCLVGWEFGIAPGFNLSQQSLVIKLMRLNLIATLIFSMSGFAMAGLQANQHFFLPALAPILYNLGQIFGAIFLAPSKGYVLFGIILPAMNLGVYGLVYGVILGSILHLIIQIPGLIIYKFKWIPDFGIKNHHVQKVLKLLGPRLITVLFVQLIFIVRDNLGSRLSEGAVSALSYGWMIQQVPETLIGTAIGTAILPTLAEQFSKDDVNAFQATVQRAIRVLIGITIPISMIMIVSIRPLLEFAFGFETQDTNLLMWVTRGYLIGLAGHCLLEINARSFYARQNAVVPLMAAILNVSIYISVGSLLYKTIGAAGISLTDSLAFTGQAIFLFIILNKRLIAPINIKNTLIRSILAAGISATFSFIVMSLLYKNSMSLIIIIIGSLIPSGIIMLLIMRDEINELRRL